MDGDKKIDPGVIAIIAAVGVCLVLFLVSFLSRTLAPSIRLRGAEALEPAALSPEDRLSLLLGYELAEEEPAEGRINVNTASVEELMELPGIGRTLAERIVAYRTYNGNFQRAEDLMNVTGIGSKTLAEIKDFICFFPPH